MCVLVLHMMKDFFFVFLIISCIIVIINTMNELRKISPTIINIESELHETIENTIPLGPSLYTKSDNHVLMPNLDMVNVKRLMGSECFKNDRVIEIQMGKAGLTDRTGKILLLAGIACHLNARIIVQDPCELLTSDHNNKKKTPCNKRWDDYVNFPVYRKQDDKWFKCDYSILTTKLIDTDIKNIERITHELLTSTYNTSTSFHWKLKMSVYKMAKIWKMVNNTLPHECNVAREFASQVVIDSKSIIEKSLPQSFLGLKIRRGDDSIRTKRCSQPSVINKFISQLGFENMNIFIMMEDDNVYKKKLSSTLNTSLIFEKDIVNGDTNYDMYLKSYYILEHAPLGRIEIRRLEKSDKNYVAKNLTCSLRYFPPDNSQFLNSGFSPRFIDYNFK